MAEKENLVHFCKNVIIRICEYMFVFCISIGEKHM